MTAKRRLKNARITHISLCRKGRNKLKTIMKSGDRLEVPLLVSKMDAKEGLLYSLVWAPEFADDDGDVMNQAEIQKMAHGFLSNGGNIDVEHDLDPLSQDQVQIAETLIVQKGDDRFSGMTYDGTIIDPTGSWGLVLKILDPELKAAYERGEWDGVSMFGQAEGSPVHKNHPEPEIHVMDKEALEAIAKAVAAAVTSSLAADREAQVKKAAEDQKAVDLKKAQDELKNPKGIEFEGDPLKAEDVAKHQEKLAVVKVDWNDPKSVEDYQASLVKSADKAKAKGQTPEEIEKAEKITALEKEIATLEKSSNVSGQDQDQDAGDDGKSKADAETFGLNKSELEGAQLGVDLIAAAFGPQKKETVKN